MTKPKLYALLVGINNYPKGIRKLAGCHNDVSRMQSYLKEQADYFDLAIAPPLLDDRATKANIVQHFRSHFKAAQAEDTVLFYFSGHGCREEADPQLWPNEYDKKLEGLVCYNPVPWNGVDKNELIGPKVLLVDKELRYLIWELMQGHPGGQGPHVVMLADCCHSGDHTRAAAVDPLNFGIRQVEYTARKRALTEFLFPATWLEQKQTSPAGEVEDYLEGAHIQMGACQARQLAKETELGPEGKFSGVFTYYLLAFLRYNQGNLSYYDLRYHLKVFTRFRYEQVPQIYIPPAHSGLYHRGFLNRPIKAGKPFVAQLHHDEQNGWILNKGGLDSVSRRSLIKVQIGAQQSLEARPQEVHPDLSLLTFAAQDQLKLDTQQTYPCQIEGLRGEPLNLCIETKEEELPDASFLESLQEKMLEQVKGLNFVPEAKEGAYTLHFVQGEYRLSSDNCAFRPIVRPIGIQSDGAIAKLGQYLRQISQWEYVKGLQSELVDQSIFGHGLPLDIRINLLDGNGNFRPKAKLAEEFIELPLAQKDGKWTGRVQIWIRNKYDRPLWVCPLYLDTDFSVSPLLKTRVESIEPKAELLVKETNISLKTHFYDYNWPADVSTIKFIVSTQDNIEVAPLLMEQGLPLPVVLEELRKGENKGLDGDEEEALEQKEGWVTQTLTLQIPNPEFNRIDEAKLAAMRAHGVLKDYVEGIWGKP
jgi:Caspase domain